jgi:protein-tyrosine phosphatase
VSNAFEIIDIHAHVLPGLDDGPRALDESLEMCRLYVTQGVTTVVATPHMGNGTFDVTSSAVRRGVRVLSEACREHALQIEILPGADVHLQPRLLDMLDAGELLTLADTGRYLLLELPAQAVPRIESLVADLAARGVTPILTHPERNPDLLRRPDRLAELVECGCLVQVTAGALLGGFGCASRWAAEEFIEAGLVHVAASDAHAAHGRRRAELLRAADHLVATVGEHVARDLLDRNPARIIRGESLRAYCAQGMHQPATILPGNLLPP